jgi:predicted amino acid racemase
VLSGAASIQLLRISRLPIEEISPLDPRITILGGSSDYLVADATAAVGSLRTGDELAFSLSYGALLAAMTSEYVEKRPFRTASPLAATAARK